MPLEPSHNWNFNIRVKENIWFTVLLAKSSPSARNTALSGSFRGRKSSPEADGGEGKPLAFPNRHQPQATSSDLGNRPRRPYSSSEVIVIPVWQSTRMHLTTDYRLEALSQVAPDIMTRSRIPSWTSCLQRVSDGIGITGTSFVKQALVSPICRGKSSLAYTRIFVKNNSKFPLLLENGKWLFFSNKLAFVTRPNKRAQMTLPADPSHN